MTESVKDPHLKIWQMHHGYIGGIMFFIGLFGVLGLDSRSWAVAFSIFGILGLLIAMDDILQHTIQHFKPGFRSPVNWLYGRIRGYWIEGF